METTTMTKWLVVQSLDLGATASLSLRTNSSDKPFMTLPELRWVRRRYDNDDAALVRDWRNCSDDRREL